MNIHVRKDGYDNDIDLERCFKVPVVKKITKERKSYERKRE